MNKTRTEEQLRQEILNLQDDLSRMSQTEYESDYGQNLMCRQMNLCDQYEELTGHEMVWE